MDHLHIFLGKARGVRIYDKLTTQTMLFTQFLGAVAHEVCQGFFQGGLVGYASLKSTRLRYTLPFGSLGDVYAIVAIEFLPSL